MKTHQLENILGLQDSCTRRSFLGVFPSDKHVAPHRKKEFIVFNLDGHKLEGSHWVAVAMEKTAGGEYRGEYFDSFGLRPLNMNIIKYLNKYCKKNWSWNTKRVQDLLADTCGPHVIYYLRQKCLGHSLNTITRMLLAKKPNPDVYVYNFVRENFILVR